MAQAAFFATKVLNPLGADTTGSQFLEPDGHFPNHIPNPENKEAMASICKAVVDNKADLGIIFDTDVDRSAIVDRTGKSINRNALIALIAAVILREHPKSTIVTDSVTSDGLAKFIADRNGKHHRFRRGYKNVINESLRLNENGEESWLAIETSGHAALRENYFLDDGAYLVAKLIVEAACLRKEGKELQDLIADLQQPVESKEIRFKIDTDDFKNLWRTGVGTHQGGSRKRTRLAVGSTQLRRCAHRLHGRKGTRLVLTSPIAARPSVAFEYRVER